MGSIVTFDCSRSSSALPCQPVTFPQAPSSHFEFKHQSQGSDTTRCKALPYGIADMERPSRVELMMWAGMETFSPMELWVWQSPRPCNCTATVQMLFPLWPRVGQISPPCRCCYRNTFQRLSFMELWVGQSPPSPCNCWCRNTPKMVLQVGQSSPL